MFSPGGFGGLGLNWSNLWKKTTVRWLKSPGVVVLVVSINQSINQSIGLLKNGSQVAK